jgi:hypothetical protein
MPKSLVGGIRPSENSAKTIERNITRFPKTCRFLPISENLIKYYVDEGNPVSACTKTVLSMKGHEGRNSLRGCAISTHYNGVLTRLLAAPKLYRSVLFRLMTKDDPLLDTRLNQPAVVDLGRMQCAIQGAAD